mmetsp:Transcript_7037/g.25937  ORF Transcript_7037/g.25937 Transcript_7037/m.25937 type:complete len:334 (-) Transcript_7037:137-1138(-)
MSGAAPDALHGPQEGASTGAVPSGDAPGGSARTRKKLPVVLFVIGMAGSGKTSVMQRICAYLHSLPSPPANKPYAINLDPAVLEVNFPANIDIRDTVKYKQVMEQYGLGPNGAIITSLNLFSTRIDQVVGLLEKRAQNEELDFILIDTPGQIEIFTWSASGQLLTESIASAFPTVMVYVMDTPRNVAPTTFMSNMLYSISILYRSKLPLLLAFNKIDIQDHAFALDWMKDFEEFQSALEGDPSFASQLSNSLCLVLEEFYRTLHAVGISALTGEGCVEFIEKVKECSEEYWDTYKVELERRREKKRLDEEKHKAEQIAGLRKDLEGVELADSQ